MKKITTTHSGQEVSTYELVEAPRVAAQLVGRSERTRRDGRMVAFVVAFARCLHVATQQTLCQVAPYCTTCLLLHNFVEIEIRRISSSTKMQINFELELIMIRLNSVACLLRGLRARIADVALCVQLLGHMHAVDGTHA